MKKLIVLILVFAVTFSCVTYAKSNEIYDEIEENYLPRTYITQPVKLFSIRKTLEQTIVEGWENLSESISIAEYNIPVSELGNVYYNIVYNNPKLYYVSTGCGYSYNPSTGMVISVSPNYTETDKNIIDKTIKEIEAATEEIMLYLDEDMTDFEKIMTVHDYMVLHYEYDYTLSNHNITIMTTKTGVCMSYAFAFKHLMDELGIECVYVSSPSNFMNHAWNMVKLDDKWYHIDLTWDDAGIKFGQVTHNYALLSDYEIQHLEDPHYGYDSGGIEANSDKYDKASWHKGVGAIITVNSIYYYVDGNNLVDQNGEIIFEGLDGKDGMWQLGGGYYFSNGNYTGLAEHNGIIYFNTDKSVYSYNPKTGKTKKIIDREGICGLFVDRNKLEYNKFDTQLSKFVKAGELALGSVRIGGTFHKDGKIEKRIFKDNNDDDIYIFSDSKDLIQMNKVTKSGMSKIYFDNKDFQTLFFWNHQLKPLKDKEIYNY